MLGRCTLTGFKILNKPKKKVEWTTIQVDVNSLKRIVKESKKISPHKTAEAEELEFAPNPCYWN